MIELINENFYEQRGEDIIMKVNNIVKQAQAMQAKMLQIQSELENEHVEASVGGGMVKATFNGQGDIVGITLDPEIINPEDKEMLEDLVLSAVREGQSKAKDLATARMSALTGGLSGLIPGM